MDLVGLPYVIHVKNNPNTYPLGGKLREFNVLHMHSPRRLKDGEMLHTGEVMVGKL